MRGFGRSGRKTWTSAKFSSSTTMKLIHQRGCRIGFLPCVGLFLPDEGWTSFGPGGLGRGRAVPLVELPLLRPTACCEGTVASLSAATFFNQRTGCASARCSSSDFVRREILANGFNDTVSGAPQLVISDPVERDVTRLRPTG